MHQALSLSRGCKGVSASGSASSRNWYCSNRSSNKAWQQLQSSPAIHRGVAGSLIHRQRHRLCQDSHAQAASAEPTTPAQENDAVVTQAVTNVATEATTSDAAASDAELQESSPSAEGASPKKGGSLWKRLVVGTALGLLGAFTILTGRKTYLALICLVVYQVTQEYFGFVTSQGISKGEAPPPALVSIATTILCISISVLTFLFNGRSGTALAIAAFSLLSLNIITLKKPRFSHLATSLFGLFYCGYLPSFWVKMRIITALPPPPAFPLPEAFTNVVKWNLGLIATFTSVACIIAADTGAFFVGKTLGRTKLTDISPKKTVEGAVGGLLSSVGTALLCWRLLSWPTSPVLAATLGVCIFFTSLFGDLIESLMKREAGLKDSGNLLPGHGGLLDRFDSYIFTGAFSYLFLTLTTL